MIIVGGGHNGLVCANYLALSKKKVLVLEKRHIVGGAACTEEVVKGYKFSRCSYVLSLLWKWVIEEIFPPNWRDHVKLYPWNPSSFTPTKNEGEYLLLGSDNELNHKEISKFSVKDANAYRKYEHSIDEMATMISPFIDEEPVTSIFGAAKAAFDFKRPKT